MTRVKNSVKIKKWEVEKVWAYRGESEKHRSDKGRTGGQEEKERNKKVDREGRREWGLKLT